MSQRISLVDWRAINTPLLLGVGLLLFIVGGSFLVPALSPYGIDQTSGLLSLTPPSADHLFGTDSSGFDVFVRVFYAARIDLSIAGAGIAIALFAGVIVGLLAGFTRSWVGDAAMRITDVMQSVPALALAVTLVALTGNNIMYVVGALAFLNTPPFLRLVRGEVLRVRELRFVDASRAMGMSDMRLILRHILPNSIAPVIVQLGLSLSYATLTIGAMTFLGIGIQAPTPEWGSMMRAGANDIVTGQWWTVVFPGIGLALSVAAFNLIAEGLEKARELQSRTGAQAEKATVGQPSVAKETESLPAVIPFYGESGSGEAILTLNNVSVAVGEKAQRVELLSDVSFEVKKGRMFGIIGETGSGKSLTAWSILGLLPSGISVTEGSIIVHGRNLLTCTSEELRRFRGPKIGMIVQNPRGALHPMYSVGDQLKRVLRAHGHIDRKFHNAEILTALELVGLPEPNRIVGLYPHQLSGGMAQRVVIATVLLCRPSLIIADEPTTGLDVTVQRQILDELVRLQEKLGLTVLMITHDLGIIAQYCDDVGVMYRGRLIEQGTTASVLGQPQMDYTRQLLLASRLEESPKIASQKAPTTLLG